MVVLSPAFAAMTALLALAGSSNVEAHPLGSNPQDLQQRKYMPPHGAAPARRFKAAQPVWSRNKGSAGTGETRFAARANNHRPHKYSHQKRSGFAQASKCKRDDSTGPSSIPGYVLVSAEDEPRSPSRGHPEEHQEGKAEDLGNIIVHMDFNTNGTETNSTSQADNQHEDELQRLQLLDATATNFTLRASKEERSLLYIVPVDANQQKNLGQIVGVNSNESISDIVLDTVTVNLVAPLLNGTATAQNWCATFSTVPPAPLHLEPCTYAPGYVGEKSSQRFQFSPRSGSLLPLFVQEQPGNVATGSWSKPEKNTTSNGRQQNQLEGDDDDSVKESTEDVSIVASSTHATSFAVSTVEHKTLNLTFVPASSQPPLPIPGCGDSSPSSSSSASGVPIPVSTSKSSSWTPTSSIHHHSKSSASSSIGSLKPSRHSHYTSPAATSTAAVSNSTAIASPSSVVSSSTSHHHNSHHEHNSSSIAAPTSLSSAVNSPSAVPTSSHSYDHHHSASESSASHHNTAVAPVESATTGWKSASSWVPVSSSAVPSSKPTESSSVSEISGSTQSAEPTSKPIESSATAPKSSAVPSNSSSVPAPSSTSSAPTASRVEGSSSSVSTSASSAAPSSSIESAPEASSNAAPSSSAPSSSAPSSSAPSSSAPIEKPESTLAPSSVPSSSVEVPSSSASDISTPSASTTPAGDSSDDSSSGLLWAVPA